MPVTAGRLERCGKTRRNYHTSTAFFSAGVDLLKYMYYFLLSCKPFLRLHRLGTTYVADSFFAQSCHGYAALRCHTLLINHIQVCKILSNLAPQYLTSFLSANSSSSGYPPGKLSYPVLTENLIDHWASRPGLARPMLSNLQGISGYIIVHDVQCKRLSAKQFFCFRFAQGVKLQSRAGRTITIILLVCCVQGTSLANLSWEAVDKPLHN